MGNKLYLPCEAADLMIGDKQNILILPRPVSEVSDGDHSFDDLYRHRSLLFLGVLSLVNNAWYSEKHSDGTSFEGWFIAGVELNEDEQITYHLPNEYLDLAATNLEHREYGPAWDGHTADDVLDRLTYWIGNGCQLLPTEA